LKIVTYAFGITALVASWTVPTMCPLTPWQKAAGEIVSKQTNTSSLLEEVLGHIYLVVLL
jgi:hypothetical protein